MLAQAFSTRNPRLQVSFQKYGGDLCETVLKVLQKELRVGICRIIVLFAWTAELT